MEETQGPIPEKKIPFENLYLINGIITGNNQFWMYLFTISFVIFGYATFQFVLFYPLVSRLHQNGYSQTEIMNKPSLLFDAVALNIDKNYVFMMELGMFVFAFLAFYLALKFIHRKTLLSVISGYDKFRFPRFFFSFFIWGTLVIAGTLVEYFINPSNFVFNPNYTGIIFSVVIAFALMPIQSGLEELIFRGYLLQGLSQIFKNGIIPLVVTSLLFGLAHLANPEVEEYGLPVMLTYYCCFALFMGAITLLDEGLELALGMHMANNIISSVLVTDEHSVIKSYSFLESNTLNVNQEILTWFGMAALTFVIFWMKYRWKNFKLLIR